MEFHVQHNGQQLGPFSEDQILAKVEDGSLSESDLAMVPGKTDWLPLADFIVREPADSPAPPPHPPAETLRSIAPEQVNMNPSGNSRTKMAGNILVVLAFLLLFAGCRSFLRGQITEGQMLSLPMMLVGFCLTRKETNRGRTGGMTAVASLNFLLGGVEILGYLFGLMMAKSMMTHPMPTLDAAASLLSIPSAGTAIVSGIGIFKVAPWGRTWIMVYVVTKIAVTLLAVFLTTAALKLAPNADQTRSAIFGVLIGCGYPMILLFLINTRKWKETFGNNLA